MKALKLSKLLISLASLGLVLSGCSFLPNMEPPSKPQEQTDDKDDEQKDDEKKTYTVTWKNWDDSVLEIDTDVPDGTLPTYDGMEPTKPNDDYYTYSFNGWYPNIRNVHSDQTYNAKFYSTPIYQPTNTYIIEWKNWNGEMLEVDYDVPEGTWPTYNGPTPFRPSDDFYDYNFNGWSPSLHLVNDNQTYDAVFNAVLRHVHTFSSEWSYDEYNHWHASTCGHDLTSDMSAHTFGEWVVDSESTEDEHGQKHRTCSICGYAETEELPLVIVNDERFVYYEATGGYGISGLKDEYKDLEEVVIPRRYNGEPIVEIGNYSFNYNKSIKSITLPSSVRKIGEVAFYQCFNLEHVNIPEDSELKEIGNDAFHFCIHLKEINIPDGITEIDEQTFYDCLALHTINISSSSKIKSFGHDAFNNCLSLTSITLPSGLKSIGSSAFERCVRLCEINNLSYLSINAGSSDNGCVGKYARYIYCENDSEITNALADDWSFNKDEWHSEYVTSESVTADVEKTANYIKVTQKTSGYTWAGKLLIHSNITLIAGVNYRVSITLESDSKVTDLEYGFGGWDDDFKRLKEEYTYTLSGTKSKTIQFDVNTASDFNNPIFCLKMGHVPAGVSIKASNFSIVIVGDKQTSRVNIDNNGFVTYDDGNEKLLLHYVGEDQIINIPEGITGIASYAFYGYTSALNNDYMMLADHVKIRKIIVPEGVTEIEQNAFYSCNSLIQLILPSSLVSFANNAIINCEQLKEIINKSDLELNYTGCSIINNENETTIAEENDFLIRNNVCLAYIGNAKTITAPNNVTEIASYAFAYNEVLEEIIIPNNVIEIHGRAFTCSNIQKVTLPNSITSISFCTFEYCESLKTIAIPDSVTSISINAFHCCTSLVEVIFGEESQLQSIGSGAFDTCNSLQEINIGKNVSSIAELNNLPSLININVNEDNEYYSSIYGVLYNKDQTELIRVPETRLFDFSLMPNTVTTIKNNCFYRCFQIETIVIPDGVKILEDQALFGLDRTSTFVLPTSIESIGFWCFTFNNENITFTYLGTMEEWNNIDIDGGAFVGSYFVIHCLDGDIVLPNNP